MADLHLRMTGDASGAADAMKHVGHEAGALHEVLSGALKGALGSTVTTFSNLETAAEKAAEVVKDFIKESIEEYAKSEKAALQLRAAAGSLTRAFQEQAEEIGKSLNIKAEDIEHMQTLLLRYGAAPDQIEEATKAVLNFASATGQDANSALMMMIRGVESGTGSLGRMGVSFKATGNFTKDLTAATEALNDKFGGAAESDAHGLAGRTKAVGLAMERLHETFGKMFDELDARYGILDKIAKAIDSVAASAKRGSLLKDFAGTRGSFDSNEAYVRNAFGFDEKDPEWQKRIGVAKDADQRAAALMSQLKASGAIPPELGPKYEPGELGSTPLFEASKKDRKTKKEKSAEQLALDAIEEQSRNDERLRRQEEFDKKSIKEEEDAELKKQEIAAEAAKKNADFSSRELEEQLKREEEFDKKSLAQASETLVEHEKEQKAHFDRMAQVWQSAGEQIGAAMVNAISDQLKRIAEGGDADPAVVAGDIVQTILTIVGTAVGTYYGAPQLGGAVGGLIGTGANIAIQSASQRKRHDGGWIERFHAGGWPALGPDEQMIIAQTGERMLSRREVAAMGGAAGVEAAARGGGGGLHVHLSAIDTRSSREFFENDGGRGFYNALRTGRGSLVPLFGAQ